MTLYSPSCCYRILFLLRAIQSSLFSACYKHSSNLCHAISPGACCTTHAPAGRTARGRRQAVAAQYRTSRAMAMSTLSPGYSVPPGRISRLRDNAHYRTTPHGTLPACTTYGIIIRHEPRRKKTRHYYTPGVNRTPSISMDAKDRTLPPHPASPYSNYAAAPWAARLPILDILCVGFSIQKTFCPVSQDTLIHYMITSCDSSLQFAEQHIKSV